MKYSFYEFDDDYDDRKSTTRGGSYKNTNKKRREKMNKRGGHGHYTKQDEIDQWNQAFGGYEDIEDMNEIIREPSRPAKKVECVDRARVVSRPTTAQHAVSPPPTGTETSSTTAGTGLPPMGPNTHTIRGNMIDFDRVAAIEKVESEYNGRQTYGIKFLFVGNRGTFRVAWFNQNVRERDNVFNNEYAFWYKIKNMDGSER